MQRFVPSLNGVIVLLLIFFVTASYSTSFYGRTGPELEVGSEDLSFRNVWRQDAYQHFVRLRNTTDETLDVVLRSSCDCDLPIPSSLQIKPKASAQIAMTLDLWDSYQSNYSTELIAETSDSIYKWSIIGTSRQVLTPQPSSAFFGGSHSVYDTLETEPLTLQITSCIPLDEIKTTTTGVRIERENDTKFTAYISAPDMPAAIKDGAPLSERIFAFDVDLRPISSRAGDLPCQLIPVTGLFVPRINAEPASVDLGQCAAGADVVGSFKIRSVDGSQVKLLSLGVNDHSHGGKADLQSVPTQGGSEHVDSVEVEVAIRFERGLNSIVVQAELEDEGGRIVLVDVPVEGFGYFQYQQSGELE